MPIPAINLSDRSGARPASDAVRIEDQLVSVQDIYRKAMRNVAGTVAIVTTDGPSGRVGATVTAFCSLCVDPPTILTCLRSNSRIAQAVDRNGIFALNVIPDDAGILARTFSGEFDTIRPDRFEGIRLIERPGVAPTLDGALCFICRVVRREQQDSHSIFIGRVDEVQSKEVAPLIYHNGSYCCVRGMSFPKADTK